MEQSTAKSTPWLDEGEEIAAKPNAPLNPEELTSHLGQGPFEIGHVMLRSTANPSS
jgi:hypothetical protein